MLARTEPLLDLRTSAPARLDTDRRPYVLLRDTPQGRTYYRITRHDVEHIAWHAEAEERKASVMNLEEARALASAYLAPPGVAVWCCTREVFFPTLV